MITDLQEPSWAPIEECVNQQEDQVLFGKFPISTKVLIQKREGIEEGKSTSNTKEFSLYESILGKENKTQKRKAD